MCLAFVSDKGLTTLSRWWVFTCISILMMQQLQTAPQIGFWKVFNKSITKQCKLSPLSLKVKYVIWWQLGTYLNRHTHTINKLATLFETKRVPLHNECSQSVEYWKLLPQFSVIPSVIGDCWAVISDLTEMHYVALWIQTDIYIIFCLNTFAEFILIFLLSAYCINNCTYNYCCCQCYFSSAYMQTVNEIVNYQLILV